MFGPVECLAVTAWGKDEPAPMCITAAMLLVYMGNAGWLLSHILIEDDDRRKGYATELVRHYEQRFGQLGACWASKEGAAFAKAYQRKWGPRPHWKIAPPPVDKRILEAVK